MLNSEHALTTLIGIAPGTFVYAGLGHGIYVLSADEPLNTSVTFSPLVFAIVGFGVFEFTSSYIE